jgi:hypothetical protein
MKGFPFTRTLGKSFILLPQKGGSDLKRQPEKRKQEDFRYRLK